MHPRMLYEVVERCRQREREGDCPSNAPFSVEALESAVIELAKPGRAPFPLLFDNAWLNAKIKTDPDIDADNK